MIFEYTPLGSSVRVTAVDCATGAEAYVLGPMGAPQRELERLALQKLQQKILRESGAVPSPKKSGDAGGGRGGIVV